MKLLPRGVQTRRKEEEVIAQLKRPTNESKGKLGRRGRRWRNPSFKPSSKGLSCEGKMERKKALPWLWTMKKRRVAGLNESEGKKAYLA